VSARVIRLHRPSGTEPITLGDEALVAACGVGDLAALGALYDRHHEAVARFIARLSSRGSGEVDDLVHDTFLAAHSAAPRFRGGSTVKTWLLGIASNVVRHSLRSRGRRLALADAITRLTQEPVAPPDATLQASELRSAVAEAIASLPHDLRVVFVLCDLEELSGAEVAAAVGIPEGSVYRRRHEARRALRERLGSVR